MASSPEARIRQLQSQWQNHDDQIAIRTGDDIYNPPTIATARNRRLESDINDRRRAAGLPPIDMTPRSTPGPDDVATLDRHRNFEASMGLVPDEDQGKIPWAAAARGQAPAAPVAPPEDPIQENFDRQNQQWQDFVERHGISPEEAANRTPTGQGGEIRVDGKVVKRTPAPTPERAQHNAQTMDRIKRNRWRREQASRFRNEIARGDTSLETLMGAYDKGSTQPGIENPHMAGAVAAFDITQDLRARQEARRGLNVDRQRQQNAMAQAVGVPRGFIIAQQSIDQAMADGDPARASAIAATYGQIYGKAFTDWSTVTNNRLAAEAEAKAKIEPAAPDPLDRMLADGRKIDALPPGPERLGMWRFHARNMLPEGADEKQVEQAVQQRYRPHAQRLLVKPVNQWTNDERQEFQEVTGKMGYPEWLAYTGRSDDPQSQQMFHDLTGNSATWGQWFSSLNPFG